jgi:hypothetical protein
MGFLPIIPPFLAYAHDGWHSVRQADWRFYFQAVFFLPDGRNGWAAGLDSWNYFNGVMLHTTNGGVVWNMVGTELGKELRGVYFTSRTHPERRVFCRQPDGVDRG